MKIIVSGGGTGGHIYPALTLIRTIQELEREVEVLYVGTQAGLEADIIPKEKLPFATVEIRSFERKLSLKNLWTAGMALRSACDSRRIIRDFAPDIVIGTGGYVCGPVLLAASLMGIPTLIQEQNVFAGITNKLLARFVTKVAVGYREAAAHFPAGKTVFTGNPIRAEVLRADRSASLREFGLKPEKLTLLVSGGSRGARSINQAMFGAYRRFLGSEALQILHVTGAGEYESVLDKVRRAGINLSAGGNIIIKPYLYDMPKALAIADLAVFRAGAIGLAELAAKGIPSILVPYPYAAENHQEYNALAMQRRGAALVIRDRELTEEKLTRTIEALLADREKLASMAAASLAMGRPQAASEIAALAIALAKENL